MRDLVYLVRSGSNEELRYSLRSVAKHADGLFRKVWVVGVRLPRWLTGVHVLPIPDGPVKHQTMRDKVRAVCDEPGVSDEFVLMNDDYFLAEPIDEWVVYHMGPASAWWQEIIDSRGGHVSRYMRDVKTTCDWMAAQGYGDVLIRETHSPTIWDKRRLAAVLDRYPADQPVTVVDLYAAAGCGGEGEYALNAKAVNGETFAEKVAAGDSPWLSSNDTAFRREAIGRWVRKNFTVPSRFEV